MTKEDLTQEVAPLTELVKSPPMNPTNSHNQFKSHSKKTNLRTKDQIHHHLLPENHPEKDIARTPLKTQVTNLQLKISNLTLTFARIKPIARKETSTLHQIKHQNTTKQKEVDPHTNMIAHTKDPLLHTMTETTPEEETIRKTDFHTTTTTGMTTTTTDPTQPDTETTIGTTHTTGITHTTEETLTTETTRTTGRIPPDGMTHTTDKVKDQIPKMVTTNETIHMIKTNTQCNHGLKLIQELRK